MIFDDGKGENGKSEYLFKYRKSKFTILAIIALFTVFSALCQKVVKVPSQQKLKDAHDISESFKENVEYFRLFSDTTEFGK